jgi:hypothetical protein
MPCEHSANAAPYVLGSLDDQDGFSTHLLDCEQCRADVAQLQPAADTLAAAVPAMAAPDHLRERIMSTVRAEAELLRAAGSQADRPLSAARRSRWPRLPLLAAAMAMAAAAVLVVTLGTGAGGQVHVTAGRFAASLPGARAYLRQVDDRAELVVSGMPQPPAGKIYEVWLGRGTAPRPTDALFGVTRSGGASVNVPGSLRGVREVLVTPEPLGGSPHPTSAPVLSVTLRA